MLTLPLLLGPLGLLVLMAMIGRQEGQMFVLVMLLAPVLTNLVLPLRLMFHQMAHMTAGKVSPSAALVLY